MMKDRWLTAVISAAVGAGLVFFALGFKGEPGVEGWLPVNEGVAQALATSEDKDSKAPAKAAEAAEDKQKKSVNSSSASSVNEATAGVSELKTGSILASGQEMPIAKTGVNSSSPAALPAANDGLIHINSAGLVELQDIPGIGAKKAQAILDYRNEHGSFKQISDLTKIKGIGDKMLQKMKPYIGL